MSATTREPDDEIVGVGEAMRELMRTEEIGALAVLDGRGYPSVSPMHFACDGFVAYIHTFAMFRKHLELQRDGRVSYAIWHEPPDGYHGRRQVHGVQVTGRARIVTEPDEVQTALQVSYAQFDWLQDNDVYAAFRKGRETGAQAFFRIDPIEALWHDGRIAMSYRRLVTFDPDTAEIGAIRPYPPGAQG